jgi:glycosyltransferase involved in cell wall biosynthesis
MVFVQMKKKIVVIGALPLSLVNFRGVLLKSLSRNGLDVTAMASGASKSDAAQIKELADTYIDYPVARNGLNPIVDFKTFLSLKRVFTESRPDIVLAYTIKPIIWGGFAARITKTPKFFALVTGLGFAFQKGGLLKNLLVFLVKTLYKIALKNAAGVIFQNPDNMAVFIKQGIVSKEKSYIVNGSGVDLSYFIKEELPKHAKFLLIARLLGDKGIREYCEAAKIVKERFPEAQFDLVGPEDSSPNGIKAEEVYTWQKLGAITYHGGTNDVRPFLRSCAIFVLPSYHEGMPRTVLEAMAMGRPILTTNVPGCRETVLNGHNGWLVEKASIEQLVDRMTWYIEHPESWQSMGDNSHKIAMSKFDVSKVNADLMHILGVNNEKNF